MPDVSLPYCKGLQRGRAHVSAERRGTKKAFRSIAKLQRGRAHVSAERTFGQGAAREGGRFNGAALT